MGKCTESCKQNSYNGMIYVIIITHTMISIYLSCPVFMYIRNSLSETELSTKGDEKVLRDWVGGFGRL